MLESRFGSIISRSSTDIGRTKLHTLNVQVTEGSPVFVKQYTIPLKYQNFIDNETKRLEEVGLISRSLSNWSAPCMVVPKKQDPHNPHEVQLRMVIGYRQLNKRIITSRAPDRNGKIGKVISNYPIPTIESLLARLEGCKYFSILDLRSGYHIGLSEQSKPLTAFTTHSGKFQWNVLPFGIGIGVQTFSFVINKAIGHCSDFAANYLDDIIVFSRTAEDHMEHLERIFAALQMADFKIKVSKCEFFKKHVSYLGFLIGETGIRCNRTSRAPDRNGKIGKVISNYPIPTIESLLARLEGCKYFSILDLRSGYHHIGLSEQSKPLTAFTMHSGKFQWNVLPFGIGIGVQTISFVINKTIGHCSDFAANYLDDIIVFSRTAEDHMEHLERIFAALQMADLKIKVSKCEFFKKHVSYLGFLIGETGIRCNRTKVEATNKIATPTSIEEVSQLNGMCSYYWKFILHYSDISKCFNDMTKKGATFNWTKECNAAFKLLKEKLMEDPILISPQVDKDYVIHCDASKYSYSGIQQTRPSTEGLAPVAYFSGNFNKTQVKWNITEKEAYAIYKSVKKFVFYITEAKTTVFSDHKPLKNFFEGGMNITKLDRWSLDLQEFDISLEFIQGKLNTVADVISCLKNGGLYVEHSKEDQKVNTVTNLDERIEEVLDITSKPLNFEKVFSMDTVISRKELLLCQKRDRLCRKLARTAGRHSDFMINHEGLLIKQVSILRNTYRGYVIPQSLVE